MKKNSIRDFLVNSFLISILLFNSKSALASLELDRTYALETVGLLRSSDNMDGLFADYVLAAYKDYFVVQSRFTLQDLTKADALLVSSKLPFSKIIDDPKILQIIAKSSHSETLIRTKITKEGPSYRFSIDWLHMPSVEAISSVNFIIEEPKDGHRIGMVEIREYLQKAMDRLISKVPFKGQVTGRDSSTVTLNIGLNSGIRKGDEVVIGSIEEVKKHPLLHSIVDWRLSPVGKLSVESVDEGMAFARVIDEDPAKKINHFHKIVEFYTPKPVKNVNPETVEVINPQSSDEVEKPSEFQTSDRPRLGWANAGLWFGFFSREYSSDKISTPKSGGGLLVGVKPEAEIWLNKNWFANLGFMYGVSSYSPDSKDGAPATTDSISASVKGLHFGGGYNYYLESDLFGPMAFARLNYRSTQYDLSISSDAATSAISLSGLSFGIGGDLPIRDQYGALLSIDLGIMTGASENGLNLGDASSVSDAAFFLGGYFRNSSKTRIQAGLDFTSSSIDFLNTVSVSHKVVAVTASYLFYF